LQGLSDFGGIIKILSAKQTKYETRIYIFIIDFLYFFCGSYSVICEKIRFNRYETVQKASSALLFALRVAL
jgi:hypothetical protein